MTRAWMSSCKVPKCRSFQELHLGCLLKPSKLCRGWHQEPCWISKGKNMLKMWETLQTSLLRGQCSLVQGTSLPASLWAPVQEVGEEENTFHSGKVLDKSILAEVLMHGCFFSLGLIWCRSLPLQASIEALLINLLKCRFSNIMMTEHCCLLMEKKLTAATREEPQPDGSKGGMESAALLNGTVKGGGRPGTGKWFLKQASQRKLCSFDSLIPWMILLFLWLTSWSDQPSGV